MTLLIIYVRLGGHEVRLICCGIRIDHTAVISIEEGLTLILISILGSSSFHKDRRLFLLHALIMQEHTLLIALANAGCCQIVGGVSVYANVMSIHLQSILGKARTGLHIEATLCLSVELVHVCEDLLG